MEVLSIEYAKGDKVYLPVTQAHLLTRYKSMGKTRPRLHTLGGRKWRNDRTNAEQGARDLAARLLENQAARQTKHRPPSPPDTAQQAEFEAAFPYTETRDQLTATDQLKTAMEKPQPMDQLLCGDVGFGKTEVAMRCAFKAVQNGQQVALLVPTTVLAQQHHDSFIERMAAFPITIDMVCRFRTRKQQNETLARTHRGEIDILIGTHRILSQDVQFKTLGLLIIDEEQRFGVTAKEQLKWLRRDIDIITMSATPIPRTLYMSLTGVRDLATIKTAPQERQPVQTHVIPYDEPTIVQAIQREIQRGGQIFYLHNRVKTIHHVENRLRALLPDLRIAVAHGQMGETQLSEIMHAFVEGRFDLLLCTTIIESGVDIPNCNTLFVENAERFGLSDLYQLRGRVGRSHHKAFAYFMLTQGGDLIDAARDRMNAIQRYTGLGSGFRLAMRDLEMRGAGNLLGANQSGHICNIGFDLYCQLLRRTIAQLQGKTPPPLMDVAVRIDFLNLSPASDDTTNGAFIPYDYIEDENLRLRLYQRLSALAEKKEITLIQQEIKDRFGPLPPPVQRLLLIAQLRIHAAAHNINAITVRDNQVMLNTPNGYRTQSGQHPHLEDGNPTQRLKALIKLI
ncbi:MAG: transcription-repair coupling factor [Kiritimatiellaceae bacterium TMED266]|nr:MAG: transcription-repair coupling factor [Kiritimatiellaceae bacterium TMED266]